MAIERRHIASPGKPRQDKEHAEAVDDVIDVEAVARPLLLTDPRERTVEAVAEPVQGQPRNGQQEQDRPAGRHA